MEKLIKGFIPDPPKGWECYKKNPGLQNIHTNGDEIDKKSRIKMDTSIRLSS